jgi:hypothetical protein
MRDKELKLEEVEASQTGGENGTQGECSEREVERRQEVWEWEGCHHGTYIYTYTYIEAYIHIYRGIHTATGIPVTLACCC